MSIGAELGQYILQTQINQKNSDDSMREFERSGFADGNT